MKKLACILPALVFVAACQEEDPNDRPKVTGFKVEATGENAPISGGSSDGDSVSSSGPFTHFSYSSFHSYLNSDIARVPIKLSVSIDSKNHKRKLDRTYMYDVFLQRSEIIDIINNKSLQNFRVTSNVEAVSRNPDNDRRSYNVCYDLKYFDRQVDVESPGHAAHWCEHFDNGAY